MTEQMMNTLDALHSRLGEIADELERLHAEQIKAEQAERDAAGALGAAFIDDYASLKLLQAMGHISEAMQAVEDAQL